MIANPDAPEDAHVSEVHLLGVPPLTHYVGHVRRQAIGGDDVAEGTLIDQWREAARHYERLADTESEEADRCGVESIPAARQPWVDAVSATPDFKRDFENIPVAFAMVELDRLVVYQPRIGLEHAARFSQSIADCSSAAAREEALFGICLPLEPQMPRIRASRTGQHTFVFQSDLPDLRVHSPRLLADAMARAMETANGVAQTGIAVPVGFGAPHLNVVRLGERMVLNNGYHRAYALRAAGFTHVPCVVQAINHPAEIAFAGGSPLIGSCDRLFGAPRPPLFKDFFDPRLTTRLRMPRSRKQIQITVDIDVLRVPD